MQFAFIVCQSLGLLNYMKTKVQTLAFTSNETFLKNEKRSGISLPASFFFCMIFEEKYFSL